MSQGIAADITCATSFDERFDPQNVLSANKNEMWVTTGMFPQELTITLREAKTVKSVKFISTGIKKAHVKGCTKNSGNGFNSIGETPELNNTPGQLQQETIVSQNQYPFSMLKFVITEGWEDFVSIHCLEIN